MSFEKEEFEKNFIDQLVSGNYWITKSMDQMRNKYSGTFWYMKKWLTLYNYIFLKEEMFKEDYDIINKNFDKFLKSLDKTVQDEATEFFSIDEMTELHNFIAKSDSFTGMKEKEEWIKKSKEFYFMYILKGGAQASDESGKKKVKQYLSENHTYEELLKYLDENRGDINSDQIKRDFSAGNLRNEVLLCKYYGLIKNNKIYNLKDSLTEVGQKFIEGNFFESLIIWEHQKLKMISQPPVIDINNVYRFESFDENKFSVNYNPYTLLIKMLDSKKIINNEDYRYIISRCNKDFDYEGIRAYICDYNKNLIKDKLKAFNRKSDIDTEDFNKELRKYMLGLVNLERDKNTNYYSFIAIEGSNGNINGYSVSDEDKYSFIKDMYQLIETYKISKYEKLFEGFEEQLKQIYIKKLELKDYIYNLGYIVSQITETELDEGLIKLAKKVEEKGTENDDATKAKIKLTKEQSLDDMISNINRIIGYSINSIGKELTIEHLSKLIYTLLYSKAKTKITIKKEQLEEYLEALKFSHNGETINLYEQILKKIIEDNELGLEEITEEILFIQDEEIETYEELITEIIKNTLKSNESIENDWYEYIGQFDDNIFVNLIYISMCINCKKYNFNLTKANINHELKNYNLFNKYFGIKLKDTIIKLQEHYKLGNKELYVVDESISIINNNRISVSKEDIEKISLKFCKNTEIKENEKRLRSNLIDYMRKFYISNFKDSVDGLIKCDCCDEKTFLSRANSESFLEFHHIIPFNEENANGPDHYLNLVGLCPNCHEKLHHIKKEELESLYKDIDKNNNLEITVFDRVKQLISISKSEKIKPSLVTHEGLRYLRGVKAINHEQYRELAKEM